MRLTRRGRIVVVAAAAVLALECGALWAAVLADVRPHPGPERHPAVVLCDHQWAEDSAAHLRLVSYGDGVTVYRCDRRGY